MDVESYRSKGGSLDRPGDRTDTPTRGAPFGSGNLTAKLERKRRKSVEGALAQTFEYEGAKILGLAAQREMSEIGLQSLLRLTSDADMANKLIRTIEDSATPEELEELHSQILRHLEQGGQAADLAREAILRKLIEAAMGMPGFSMFD